MQVKEKQIVHNSIQAVKTINCIKEQQQSTATQLQSTAVKTISCNWKVKLSS